MIKTLISIALFSTLLLSQKIIHNPIQNIQTGESIEIQASILGLAQTSQNFTVTLFYRSYGQQTYFQDEMILFAGQYKYTIPNTFVNNKDLEYFIVLSFEDGGIFAFPEDNPHSDPILVKSNNSANLNIGKSIFGSLKPEYQILSPEEGSSVLVDDLMISLSYFTMDDLDESKTRILLNGVDYSDKATMRSSHFILLPEDDLPDGENSVAVLFYTKSGLEYDPIVWTFNLFSSKKSSKGGSILSKGGDLNGSYSSSTNDGISTNIGEFSGSYDIDFDWLKFKSDLLLSSLENDQQQPKDRYSFNFNTSYFKIKLGDSYPSFSEYTVKGNRLRGGDILFSNNFLKIHFLSGNLVRSVQGLASDGAMLLQGNSEPVFSSSELTGIGVVDLTRDNYNFSQGLLGLNFEINPSKKFKWSFEILKVKDKVNSVDISVDNSVITLNNEMVKHLYSDMFVDINADGFFDEGEFFGSGSSCIFEHDVAGEIGLYDDVPDLSQLSDLFSSYRDTVVEIGTASLSDIVNPEICVESTSLEIDSVYTVKQKQVVITTTIENLKLIIEEFKNLEQVVSDNGSAVYPGYCEDNACFGDYEINLLESEWDGVKPQDNIVLSTDFSHNLDKGLLKIDYGIAFSMLNQNIWNPGLSYETLDKLEGTEEPFTDCNGEEDINNPGFNTSGNPFLCDGDDQWEDYMGNGEYDEGEPYVDSDDNGEWTDDEDGLFNNEPIPDFIDNVSDFEDIFQTGITQIPILPITPTKECGVDEKTGAIVKCYQWSDVATMPSMAVHINVFHNYFGHRVNWGFKQVGPEFNTLGNPYIQKNIREQYFTDKTSFFDNRLNLTFKWKRTEDGISLDQDNGQTDKFDFNLGLYPGANLPTYNLGIGIYNRSNGVDPLYEPLKFISPENDLNNNGIADTVLCSDGASYDFSCNDFPDSVIVVGESAAGEIEGVIEVYDILSTQLYQPEQTRTGQFSLSINSTVDYIYKHSVNLNIFYSEKKDLVDIDKYLILNPDYYSPRTMTQSYNLGVRTTYSPRMISTVSLGYSYYDYGLATPAHCDYFQDQRIISSDIGLIYETPYRLTGKIDPGINFSIGRGSVNFTQIGFKMGSKIKVVENLNLYLNMNYRFKSVRQEENYTDTNCNGSFDSNEDFIDLEPFNYEWNYYHNYFNNYSFGIDMRYNF